MKINYRRVFVIAGLAALTLCYIFLWLRMIITPAERTSSDFIAFYAAGRVAQINGLSQVYNPPDQQNIEQTVVGFPLAPGQVLLYNHVPFLVPLLWLIVGKSYILSFIIWAILLACFYASGTWMLTRVNPLLHSTNHLLEAGIITFYPLFVSLMNGQDTAFMYWGLCLWLVGLLSGNDPMAGLGLSLTIIRPQLALLLVAPFLFHKRKVLAWFFAGGIVLGLFSLATVGFDGFRGFINLLLVSTGGDWYGLKEPLMVNLIGLLWRLIPGLGVATIHWIGWASYVLALIGLCILWLFNYELGGKQISLIITIALFVSPHLHYHDLALLIVAFAAAFPVLVRRGVMRQRDGGLVLIACSLVLLFSGISPLLKYNMPYILMLVLILSLWLPENKIPWRSKLLPITDQQ